MRTALFACVHNAGRSQIAAAWFNVPDGSREGAGDLAGTEPGARVVQKSPRRCMKSGSTSRLRRRRS